MSDDKIKDEPVRMLVIDDPLPEGEPWSKASPEKIQEDLEYLARVAKADARLHFGGLDSVRYFPAGEYAIDQVIADREVTDPDAVYQAFERSILSRGFAYGQPKSPERRTSPLKWRGIPTTEGEGFEIWRSSGGPGFDFVIQPRKCSGRGPTYELRSGSDPEPWAAFHTLTGAQNRANRINRWFRTGV